MGWKCVEEWLSNADLPFKHLFASGSAELTFSDVYPHFFDYLFRVARNLVVFEDLPETYYEPFFKATLIINGKICCFTRTNGEKVALNCAQAAEPDLYYVPSKVLVVNPRFIGGESYNLTPGIDCEIIYCTSQDMYRYGVYTGGLYSLIDLTARQLTDNFISLNVAQKNMRLTTAFAADDEITKQSIEAVLRAMYDGQPYKVVQKTLVDEIAQLPLQVNGANQVLIQLLETHKYILSEFYAALGIDEPQQMKKERLVTAEVEQGAELPMFNIYDIVSSISDGVERVNKMFGTEIKVKINPYILKAFEGQPEETAEGSEPEASGAIPDTSEDMPVQPDAAEEDKPEQPAEKTAEEGTTSAESAEPDTVTAAAVDIIETAAHIIDIEEGGGDNADESADPSSSGEIRADSDVESA